MFWQLYFSHNSTHSYIFFILHFFISEKFAEASVLFSDIVSFTTMSAECEPMDIVAVLNDLFQKFDDLTSTHNVYKVSSCLFL